jgi:3-methyladenine DNA glycosylase AlkD
MTSTRYYSKIKAEISKASKKKMDRSEQEFVQRYLGSHKKYLGVATGDVVRIAKSFLRENSSLEINELISLLDQLFSSEILEEHFVGGKIFTLLKPDIRSQIPLSVIEGWLKPAHGWVEIDVICQSAFTGQEVLERFSEWKSAIKKFRESDIISLRRASLVLQTKPIKEVDDKELRKLAFETVDGLKHEKEVLITKAVSWLLRSLVVQNKDEVKNYILKNEGTLPRIAVRETMKKIETGRKNNGR